MIVIDKSKPVQRIILTLTEIAPADNAGYIVKLKNDSTRFEYTFPLPDNISSAPERYDLFAIASSVFDDMPSGYYTYSVFVLPDTTGTSIEDGKLLIKDLTPTEFISPANTDNENEYIIY